ncbi:hypothetical protein FO519_009951 [Halicephalobus sp. NKZ332]|nr:hypothetical protein FO519_009951 [Halicephalobus sp. NKZ332]
MLKFIGLLFLGALVWPSDSSVIIESPQLTSFGHWHNMQYCPDYMVAVGMQVKVEGDQRGGDDTGLNAVALYCDFHDRTFHSSRHRIMSGEGLFGDWQEIKYCPIGQMIVGFALRSEPDQRGEDDVAADNFAAYCGLPNSDRHSSKWIEGNTPGWGHWTGKQFCPDGYVVRGIQTQVEGNQRGGDDTSLNNVKLACEQVV